MGNKIPCNEPRRTIMMQNGNRLELHNVTAFDPSSRNMLRLWCDEGFVMVNESHIDWMIVKSSDNQDVKFEGSEEFKDPYPPRI